ncbi:DNA-directed RNA polymerase subunit alpha [bacterium]|nr:DNA-directed RNA polymerase subunit alpha [bacterium]
MKWKQIQMPDDLWEDPETIGNQTFGRFMLEPLETGYGITVGNALRRVILSSMQGAAIESIKIDGVLHEFSTITGIYEDVPEIVLNLKGVRFAVELDFPQPVKLDIEKKGDVLAGDIETPAGIKILNPEHHICTITKKKRLIIDMELGVGKGFSVADEHRDAQAPIGTISIDAIYTPVKKVNYNIEAARVGQKTDYDRLIIEIETDGSMTPRETLGMAAKMLIDHFTFFLHPEVSMEQVEEEIIDDETKRMKQLLKLPVSELELSVRANNCLDKARIRFLADLVIRTEQEMLKFRNFGRKSLQELQTVLSKIGLHFGMDVSEFLSEEELEELKRIAIEIEMKKAKQEELQNE